ncbi:MAG TPA: hypothetical protein VHV74_09355 [Pseudonocardiaceae bacterium]|jgi:phosphate transport system permease protein|nr:hypothetical protein [Pseudonocardiaceae bacterium]
MTAIDQERPTTVAPPKTTLPDRSMPHGEQARRTLGGVRGTDLLALFGSIAASLTTTGLLWTQLSPFTGWLGYVVTCRLRSTPPPVTTAPR